MTTLIHEIDVTTLTDDSTISKKIREHDILTARLRREVGSLGDEHNDQWVGMGMDYELVFGPNLEEVIAQLKRDKSDDSTVAVEYLSTEPIVMIL